MKRHAENHGPQHRALAFAGRALLLTGLLGVLCSCGDEMSDVDSPQPRFEVDESPGTGTTGGNPTPTPAATVTVEIERPLNDGVFVQWERPELNFDIVELVQLNPLTNECDVRSSIERTESRLRLSAGARLLFTGENLCRVTLRRNVGPVLRFQGTRPGGTQVEIDFADGAALDVQLTQWRRAQQAGGRLSLDVGVLAVEAVAIAQSNPDGQDLRVSDADPQLSQRLRRALGRALVGYIDGDSNGELSLQERRESEVFLRFNVTP